MRNGSEPGSRIAADGMDPRAAASHRDTTGGNRWPISTLVLARVFIQIGATSFGGLGPSLAIVERELVDKRKILTTADVAEAVAVTKLLPGSTLIQVVSFLGYRIGGWTGSAVAAVACILPPVIPMFLLATCSDALSKLSAFGPAVRGTTAAVVGLLLASTFRFGRATIGGPVALAVGFSAFGTASLLRVPAAAVVVVAGLIGVLFLSAPKTDRECRPGRGGRS